MFVHKTVNETIKDVSKHLNVLTNANKSHKLYRHREPIETAHIQATRAHQQALQHPVQAMHDPYKQPDTDVSYSRNLSRHLPRSLLRKQTHLRGALTLANRGMLALCANASNSV